MIVLDTAAVTPLMGGMAGSGMAGGMGGWMFLFPLLALLAVAALLTAGVVGFGALARDADGSEPSESDETSVERLQRRYAEGELTEAEFERALERELERQESGGTGPSPTRGTESGGETARAR